MGKRKTSSASIKLPNSSQIENETEEMKNLNEEQESPPSQKKSKPNSTEKQDMSSHEHFNNAADNFNQNDDNNNNNVNLVSDSNGLTTKPKASLATLMSNKTITLEETFGLENIFIGISGLIGAGKTTLCTALSKVLNLPSYYEPVIDNEYLNDFYRDQKKYSFTLQIYLLNNRFRQQQQIIWAGKGGVQDRTIYEDSVFAKVLYQQGFMEKRDYETYCNLFANMSNFMKKPNLIVHLDVTPQESLERIKLRNRSCESNIPIEYLQALYVAYEEFLQEVSRVIPVLKVNYNTFKTAEEMAQMIKREYTKMKMIHTVKD